MKIEIIILAFLALIFCGCNNKENPTEVLQENKFLEKSITEISVNLKNINLKLNNKSSSSPPLTESNYDAMKNLTFNFFFATANGDTIYQTSDSIRFSYFYSSYYGNRGGNSNTRIAELKFDVKNKLITNLTAYFSNSYSYNSSPGGPKDDSNESQKIQLINLPYKVIADSSIEVSLNSNELAYLIKMMNYSKYSYHTDGMIGSGRSSSSSTTYLNIYEIIGNTSLNILIK